MNTIEEGIRHDIQQSIAQLPSTALPELLRILAELKEFYKEPAANG